MLGILAGDTLALNSSAVGTLGCTSCGATLQAGPGRSYKEGALGASMQQGAGRAYQDGALGDKLAYGDPCWSVRASVYRQVLRQGAPRSAAVAAAGSAYQQCRRSRRGTSGLGAAMASGAGHACRDGALGLVNLTSDLLLGVGIGAAAGFVLPKLLKKLK